MLRYFCGLLILFICWSTYALNSDKFHETQSNFETNSELQKVYRRTLRTVADGFNERIAELSDDIESFSKEPGVQMFLEDARTLQYSAEDLQDNLFDIDSSLSIIELYRIDSEIAQLKKDWEEYKSNYLMTTTTPFISTTTTTSTTSASTTTTPNFAYSNLKRSVEAICADVEKTKSEIKAFTPDQCSGYKLMPKLIECQSVCNAVKKYHIYDQVLSTPSFQQELNFISDKCEAIVNIWKLIRNIQPDKPTIDQTCSDIGALGFDIGNYPAAKCEKDLFWKDQRILSGICSRIQKDYNFMDPETLQLTFKELEGKINELKFKWNYFRGETVDSQPFSENFQQPQKLSSGNLSWLARAQRTRTPSKRQSDRNSQSDEALRRRTLNRIKISNL